ncbi:wax ester/triacylglycerol synthase family O-acyltransferase [Streptomyces sp. PTM05]|uniref:Wax ester/triacylglycerol synthase family O-acyltransferase n=1 Tax=Streptantibioticus parmotrematis TaxID=2873249 RepID=A0ABS7QV11_9ACTN|nr:wax ester/triacylglycerol synthase domain-containing protein [Streptantibioticus parmotrematis]MBY8887053.1 wax ester/triacylglycerol synthase family O-acyltransferase [Streptantibioticus parmotrematis]
MLFADQTAETVAPQAGLMTDAFLSLGTLAPTPSDMYFGYHMRVAGAGPDLARLRSHVARRIDRVPLLTHRLTVRDRHAAWEPDPAFDVDHHVRLAPGTGLEARPAQELLDFPVDEARPRWGLWVHRGDGRAWALTYLAHHAVQDAMTMLDTLRILLGAGELPVAPAIPVAPTPRREKITGILPLVPGVLSTYLPRAASPKFPTPDPVAGRTLGQASVEVQVLRSIADATGSTVNQVHLAALTMALRSWSVTRESLTRPRWRNGPHLVVPVDTRRGTEQTQHPPYGNHIGLLRLSVPRSADDLTKTLAAIAPSTSRRRMARSRAALRTLNEYAPRRLASWAMRRVTDPRGLLLTASNVRCPAPLTAMGDEVTEVTAVPWLPPGSGCFTLLVTYRGVARLSVLSGAVSADPGALASLWARSLTRERGIPG